MRLSVATNPVRPGYGPWLKPGVPVPPRTSQPTNATSAEDWTRAPGPPEPARVPWQRNLEPITRTDPALPTAYSASWLYAVPWRPRSTTVCPTERLWTTTRPTPT